MVFLKYQDGTTDITRTVHFGKPSAHEKACYTAVCYVLCINFLLFCAISCINLVHLIMLILCYVDSKGIKNSNKEKEEIKGNHSAV